jgi:hypothetical protein
MPPTLALNGTWINSGYDKRMRINCSDVSGALGAVLAVRKQVRLR